MENKQILDTKHIKINAIVNLVSKLLTALIIFAFAKVIITFFGDEVNGIVRSTTMITGYFSIADAGIAAIVSQRLYKVIIADNKEEIIKIMSASKKIFKVITIIFIFIAMTVSFVYPLFIKRNGVIDYGFTLSLLFVLSIKVIPMYLGSMHYNIILTNTQRGYIYKVITLFIYLIFYAAATVLLYFNKPVLHTISSHGENVLVLAKGYENYKWIIIAGLAFPAISEFIIALIMKYVCDKKFPGLEFIYVPGSETKELGRDAKYTLASQITGLIVFSTDEIVLTIYSHKVGATYSMYLVSLLSFYGMVISTIRSTLDGMFSSMVPYLGLKTQGEKNIDKKTFKMYYLNVISISFFITLALMAATPIFVQAFFAPNGADYFDIKLVSIVSLNCFLYLVMSPYKNLFYIKGHFKRLLIPNIIEATINLIGSLIVVGFFGIYGILIVTTIAMTYRLVHFSFAGRRYVDGLKGSWHNIMIVVMVAIEALILIIAFVLSKYLDGMDFKVMDAIAYILAIGMISLMLISFVVRITKKQVMKQSKKIR